mgnify:CR=1 FL=1
MRKTAELDIDGPPVDDAQLALRARVDPEAFAELYRRHVNRVYRYHMVHTGSARDAEDLTSQTFTAALESIHGYRGAGSVAAWLMGIALNKRRMFFRSRGRSEFPLEEALDVPDPGPATEQAALDRIRLQQVRAGLAALNADRREAIALYFFAGLAVAEGARVLGKSEAAFKMLLSRGLQDLRTRTSAALEVQDE